MYLAALPSEKSCMYLALNRKSVCDLVWRKGSVSRQYGSFLPCRFWHQRDRLIEAGLLQQQHAVIPCAAQLHVAAASMPDLWQSRAAVGTLESVNLSCCNEQLGKQVSPCSPSDLHEWEELHGALPLHCWAHVWLAPACQVLPCTACGPMGHEAPCHAMPCLGQKPELSDSIVVRHTGLARAHRLGP